MSTITETQQTGLIKVEEITSIMVNAGDVLAKNENLVKLASDKGQTYLDTIEGHGMNDEIDAELNAWQVKAKTALEIMNNRRSPITQMMTQIAKVFTGLEAKIDPAKPDSVYSKIQAHRNAFAKQKAEAQRAKEQEILKAQNIAKEKIELKAKIEQQVREIYQNKLYAFKKSANDKFNELTLVNIYKTIEDLQAIKTLYPRDKFNEISVTVVSLYLEKAELAGLIFDTRAGLYDELAANFRENMEDIRQSLLNLVPSRKAELEEIANASKAEQKRLQDEAFLRQQAEDQRLKDEANQAKLNDEANVNLQKQIATTGNLFETTAALAEVKENSGPVRQGYKITIMSPAGWGAIFLFWFANEGQKMEASAMGKKTLDQMKAFCEKHAHKTTEKVDHIHVVYEEDYKAVAVKEK